MAVIFHEIGKSPPQPAGPTLIVNTLPAEPDAPPPAPTLGELRLALARSPEAAEALLVGGSSGRTPHEPIDASPRAFGPVASTVARSQPKF